MDSLMRLISMPGTETFSDKVDYYLKNWHETEESFITKVSLLRFMTGDGKAVLGESVRGKHLFIISDPHNCSITYNMRGYENHMSPDDHLQDVKRVITATNGKAESISLLMAPFYGARQDDRSTRESLDGAFALRELEDAGVRNIITFDLHNPKIQNATPLVSFDNLYPNYQMIKALVKHVGNVRLTPDAIVMISPDAGGVQRCLKYAEALNLDIGMFYKQRDHYNLVDGNPVIERHEFIGGDISGKDVILVDDIIATGESLVDSFYQLKLRGAKRIFSFVTFGMFTKGYASFDRAYASGVFDKLFISNLTWHNVENGHERPYIVNVDVSKYAAYIIDCIMKNISISKIVDPYHKIRDLMTRMK